MLDEELRAELARWARATERLAMPDISVIRRRARRRARRVAAGAGAGLAVAGVAAGIALASLSGAGHPAASHPSPASHPRPTVSLPPPVGWHPAGPLPPPGAGLAAAPYFVTIAFQQAPAPTLITDALTGRVVATVRAPAGSGGFVAAAPAGDDRTFVLAAQAGSATGFYELRLGAGGRPLPLTQLAVVPQLSSAGSFTVSPDGRQLAVVLGRPARVELISLVTGATRTWRSTAGAIGSDLSWAGNGELAFIALGSEPANAGLWLLDTAVGPAQPMTARLLIPDSASFGGYSQPEYPLISADGSVLFATMEQPYSQPGLGPGGLAEVMEFSAQSGQPLGAVTPPASESGMGSWCGALWADSSGSQLAAVCGRGSNGHGVEGIVHDGRFLQRDLHVPVYNQSVPRSAFIGW
jgi:hypothetical protein